MDCHSHGSGAAFFSRTDNDGDQHDMKLAFVLSNCNRSTPSSVLRLCGKGIFEQWPSVPDSWARALPEEVRV